MKNKIKKLLVVLPVLSVFLAGCTPDDFLRNMTERMAPDDDKAMAKTCLAALQQKDIATVMRQVDPQIETGAESNLMVVANVLANGNPIALELIGCNVASTPNKRRTYLTYQYQFTNTWVLAFVTIQTEGATKKLLGLHVNPIQKSLAELNAFTFRGKGPIHYVLFAFAILVSVFIIWTTVLCARTKIQRKWLWIIFILFGLTKLNLNWTTGQIGFQPISFQMPGAGLMKQGLYAPWILTASFPLGALLFLRKRKTLKSLKPEIKDDTHRDREPHR